MFCSYLQPSIVSQPMHFVYWNLLWWLLDKTLFTNLQLLLICGVFNIHVPWSLGFLISSSRENFSCSTCQSSSVTITLAWPQMTIHLKSQIQEQLLLLTLCLYKNALFNLIWTLSILSHSNDHTYSLFILLIFSIFFQTHHINESIRTSKSFIFLSHWLCKTLP